jgi:AraC family transcriptional regulator
MHPTTLLIKNMVCTRCVLAVESILRSEALSFRQVLIGKAELWNELSQNEKLSLQSRFREIGFDLIDNRSTALIEQIKHLVVQKARNEPATDEKRGKLSKYITELVNLEYTYISSLFSSIEGRTIENYFIEQRTEKVKELLTYNRLTLVQIAFELNYSSVAHLSYQFKKSTGLTPSHFKRIGSQRRKSLDNI